MNTCMHGLTVVCVCLCMCICGWVVRSTCLQGGAVFISSSGSSGTFTNCNFTSNEASVSLEEAHVDGCVWDVEVHDTEVVPSMSIFLTDSCLLPLSIYCDCFLWSAIGLVLTYFSDLARLFFAFACTCVVGKSFCDLSSHIFSWPSLPSGRSFMNPLSTSS